MCEFMTCGNKHRDSWRLGPVGYRKYNDDSGVCMYQGRVYMIMRSGRGMGLRSCEACCAENEAKQHKSCHHNSYHYR